MIELKIDPEFRGLLRKQTEEEHRQLLENLLADGEAYRPIVTWNGYIVDGHNRWEIIQKHPEIKYRIVEKHFANKHAANAWILKNQLDSQDGQRVVSDEDRTYMMGRRNAEEKLAHGSPKKVQNGPLREKGKTAQKIANEYGVGYGTVIRAEKFANGVDAIKEISPEAADKILSGNSGATKAEVREILNMTADEKKKFAQDIVSGEIKNKPNKPNASIKRNEGRSQERRESYDIIDKAFASLTNDSAKSKFTVDDLAEEIKVNGADFTSYLRRILSQRSEMLNAEGARELIRKTIDEITKEIEKVRSLL